MKPTEAETWLTGQFLNVLIDVLLMPVIKITISGVLVVYFLQDHFEKYSNIMMNRIREGYLSCKKSPTSGQFPDFVFRLSFARKTDLRQIIILPDKIRNHPTASKAKAGVSDAYARPSSGRFCACIIYYVKKMNSLKSWKAVNVKI